MTACTALLILTNATLIGGFALSLPHLGKRIESTHDRQVADSPRMVSSTNPCDLQPSMDRGRYEYIH